jgi:hypothetical protein
MRRVYNALFVALLRTHIVIDKRRVYFFERLFNLTSPCLAVPTLLGDLCSYVSSSLISIHDALLGQYIRHKAGHCFLLLFGKRDDVWTMFQSYSCRALCRMCSFPFASLTK